MAVVKMELGFYAKFVLLVVVGCEGFSDEQVNVLDSSSSPNLQGETLCIRSHDYNSSWISLNTYTYVDNEYPRFSSEEACEESYFVSVNESGDATVKTMTPVFIAMKKSEIPSMKWWSKRLNLTAPYARIGCEVIAYSNKEVSSGSSMPTLNQLFLFHTGY
ncbi:hypothetical protein KI387_043593 [Taxus chinensis]|uniref:Uncharacterized protein n=1 Tax=Taxus chinensis TaxID=29808 RepID=A0AA38C080_TAXCH|nr:hypothetical protein KI387_043593 [Taxus chinensis]